MAKDEANHVFPNQDQSRNTSGIPSDDTVRGNNHHKPFIAAIDEDSTGSDDDHPPSKNQKGIDSASLEMSSKRAKRLAMNRVSARERRRRQRVLLSKLEEKVGDLTQQIEILQDLNKGLKCKVGRLEVELASSQAVISTLSTGILNQRHSLSASSPHSIDPGLYSILLGSGVSGLSSRSNGGRSLGLNNALAERQILLDLQAYQRHQNILQASIASAASSSLAPLSNLGAQPGVQGADLNLPLLGRLHNDPSFVGNMLPSNRRIENSWKGGESKFDLRDLLSRNDDSPLYRSEEKEVFHREKKIAHVSSAKISLT